MMLISDETKAAKKALRDAGYECSVKKGVGSCRGWIHVAIRDRRIHNSNGTYTPKDCQVSIEENESKLPIKKQE